MPSTHRFVRNQTQHRYRLRHRDEINRRKREAYKMNADREKRRVRTYRRRRTAHRKLLAKIAAKE